MNESPNFLLLAILYGSLVIISLKLVHYRSKSERLQKENIEMATKLGKKVSVCKYCGEPMIMNNGIQKYHNECYTEVSNNRALEFYYKVKKNVKTKVESKVAVLHNGLEIRTDTVVGKEIANKW